MQGWNSFCLKVKSTFFRVFTVRLQQNPSYFVKKPRDATQRLCCVCSCPPGPTDSQLIMSKSERRASLLPLAHLAAWWLLLICPQASVSTSPIWTGIKGPNTNSCAEISHVSIYSYFVNQRTTHSAQIMNCYICISLFSYTWLWIPSEKALRSFLRLKGANAMAKNKSGGLT